MITYIDCGYYIVWEWRLGTEMSSASGWDITYHLAGYLALKMGYIPPNETLIVKTMQNLWILGCLRQPIYHWITSFANLFRDETCVFSQEKTGVSQQLVQQLWQWRSAQKVTPQIIRQFLLGKITMDKSICDNLCASLYPQKTSSPIAVAPPGHHIFHGTGCLLLFLARAALMRVMCFRRLFELEAHSTDSTRQNFAGMVCEVRWKQA